MSRPGQQAAARRDVLRWAALGATAVAWPRWPGAQPRLVTDPFALGVASGEPTAQSVVLWTRLAGAWPGTGGLGIEVRWEVAHDEQFAHIAQRGTALALPALGHSVHVEVAGLQPDRWYHYRFLLGDAASPIGRTRTAPDDTALAARLRLVYASCQRWEHGHYAAWRHAAAEHPDLIVFLGDYIYEYAPPRQPVLSGPVPVRTHALRHAVSLADYRDRYALYKSDPDLRAAHAACPWLVVWDDHEVENDYAGERGRNAGDLAAFAHQRSAAYQAFYENMPLPVGALVRALAGGADAAFSPRLHRRVHWGRLARLHLLDTRQHRSVQACRPIDGGGRPVGPRECPELGAPDRSMLGAAQEQWLDAGLRDATAATTQWSIVAQQTVFSPRNYRSGPEALYGTDSWDGYPAARQRLLDAVARHRPRNTVLLGGDIHQNYVCDVKGDFDRGDSPTNATIATEFCGTSISSHASTSPERVQAMVRRNPHVRFAQAEYRGYGVADITPGQWQTTLRVVHDVADRQAPVHTAATFTVADGRPGVAA